MRALLLAVAFALLLPPASGRADGAPERDRLVAQTPPGVVDVATARKLVAAGVTVVDVRTPDEFQAGHVPGAVNIPYDEMEKRYAELGPPSTPLVLYCHSGRRSGVAVQPPSRSRASPGSTTSRSTTAGSPPSRPVEVRAAAPTPPGLTGWSTHRRSSGWRR